MNTSAVLIEDNPALQNIYSIALNRLGYEEVIVIGDGDEASTWIGSATLVPLFIVVDLGLPGKNGEILLHEIKDTPRLRNTIIIVVTANQKRAREIRENQMRGSGKLADIIIEKPFNYDDLFTHAQALLDKHREEET